MVAVVGCGLHQCLGFHQHHVGKAVDNPVLTELREIPVIVLGLAYIRRHFDDIARIIHHLANGELLSFLVVGIVHIVPETVVVLGEIEFLGFLGIGIGSHRVEYR